MFGFDDAVGVDLEAVLVVEASAAADDDGEVILHGEEGDGFVGAGLAVEEVDEDAFASGVLVGDEAEDGALGEDVEHSVGGAFFVDDGLALSLADAEEVAVDVGVVDGSGDGVAFEAEGGEGVAEDFEISVVAGEHDDAAAAEDFGEGRREIAQFDIAAPGRKADEAGGEEDVEGEHGDVFEAAAGGVFDPGLFFFGE